MCMIATLNLPPDCHMLPSCFLAKHWIPFVRVILVEYGHFQTMLQIGFSPKSKSKTGGPQILKTTSHHKNPTNCKRPTTLRPHHHGGTPIQSPSTALARRAVVLERPTFPDPSTTPSSFGQHPYHHQCFYRRNSF